MKLLFALLLTASALLAQVTNPNCPGATGATPHCIVVTITPPTTGPTPTGYNVYSGGTTAGNCASLTAATCSKIGTLAVASTTTPLTLTINSSATLTFVEGQTYHVVLTSLNGTAESVPGAEVTSSNSVPFLVPNPPSGAAATLK